MNLEALRGDLSVRDSNLPESWKATSKVETGATWGQIDPTLAQGATFSFDPWKNAGVHGSPDYQGEGVGLQDQEVLIERRGRLGPGEHPVRWHRVPCPPQDANLVAPKPGAEQPNLKSTASAGGQAPSSTGQESETKKEKGFFDSLLGGVTVSVGGGSTGGHGTTQGGGQNQSPPQQNGNQPPPRN